MIDWEVAKYGKESPAIDTDELSKRAQKIYSEGTSSETERAYRNDIKYFFEWYKARFQLNPSCAAPVDIKVVATFITDHLEGLPQVVDKKLVEEGVKSELGTHSLRSGFITEAGKRGVSLADAMALSGHRSIATATSYHRSGSAVRNPAGDLAG